MPQNQLQPSNKKMDQGTLRSCSFSFKSSKGLAMVAAGIDKVLVTLDIVLVSSTNDRIPTMVQTFKLFLNVFQVFG